MSDANISQEEIDALLGNVGSLETGEFLQQTPQTQVKGIELSPLERSNLEDEILQGLAKSKTGLSVMLNYDVEIQNPYAELRNKSEVIKILKGNNVIFDSKISGFINGNIFLVIPTNESHKIVNILIGGTEEDTSEPLDTAQIATIKDALNVLIYSLISHFSARTGETITPLGINVLNGNEFIQELPEDYYLRFQCNFILTGLIDTKIYVFIPYSIVKSLLSSFKRKEKNIETTEEIEEEPEVPIKDVEFPSISTTTQGLASPNVELLLDVQMTVTVELGRTKKYIKEILEFGEGTIIELDKQAGEHVDVLVNGKLIARGEVVVIDENFGVRITEIISPKDKLGLKKKS